MFGKNKAKVKAKADKRLTKVARKGGNSKTDKLIKDLKKKLCRL